jgi:hypothetical protein
MFQSVREFGKAHVQQFPAESTAGKAFAVVAATL